MSITVDGAAPTLWEEWQRSLKITQVMLML